MAKSRDEITDAFVEKYPELPEMMANAEWSKERRSETDGITVRITNSEMLNAANHRFEAMYNYRGDEGTVVYQSGDWNGFMVEEFGDVCMTIPERPVLRLVPDWSAMSNCETVEDVQRVLNLYKMFRELRADFIKVERDYAYDSYFAPGGKTEGYYRPKVASYKCKAVRILPSVDPLEYARLDAPHNLRPPAGRPE